MAPIASAYLMAGRVMRPAADERRIVAVVLSLLWFALAAAPIAAVVAHDAGISGRLSVIIGLAVGYAAWHIAMALHRRREERSLIDAREALLL